MAVKDHVLPIFKPEDANEIFRPFLSSLSQLFTVLRASVFLRTDLVWLQVSKHLEFSTWRVEH